MNDLGGSIEGEGSDAGPAADVAGEIDGLADSHDVSTVDGAQALVDVAVEHHGRLDVLVNNAGIMRWAGMPEVDEEALRAHLAVHVGGSFNTTRAAWPQFVGQGYGRIVMTTSAGIFGHPRNTSYATAKAGVIGLTRSLALAGAKHGIKVNAIAPAAATRMGGDTESGELAPELVAPMAAYLSHEDCPVSGEVYAAGAGRFSRIFVGQTPGWIGDGEPTVEDVAAHWSTINDEPGYSVPTDLFGWSADFTNRSGG